STSSARRSFTPTALLIVFFFQAEDGIRDKLVTGVQTCALPICPRKPPGCPACAGPKRSGRQDPDPERRAAGNASDPGRIRTTRRSEERRVGKECRAGWEADQERKNGGEEGQKEAGGTRLASR